jgi:AcrR family transcriptional regulator
MTAHAAELRRQQSRAQVRRAILEAAESILVEVGYEGFSVRKLVNRCGYSAPTVYHHFGDKTGLVDAVLEERLAGLVVKLRAVPQSDDPVANMRALTRAFADFALVNPTFYWLLTQPRGDDVDPVPSGEEANAILAAPLDELAAAGQLAHADVELVRQSMWVQIHGLVSLPPVRPDVAWHDDLLDQTIEALIRGWMSPEASS